MLPELMNGVALKTKYKGKTALEENRRTPAKMAKILKGIVTRDFPGM